MSPLWCPQRLCWQLLRRHHANVRALALRMLPEANLALKEREDGVVLAQTHVLPRAPFCAPLAHNDTAWLASLSIYKLDAQALRVGPFAVLGGPASLLGCPAELLQRRACAAYLKRSFACRSKDAACDAVHALLHRSAVHRTALAHSKLQLSACLVRVQWVCIA